MRSRTLHLPLLATIACSSPALADEPLTTAEGVSVWVKSNAGSPLGEITAEGEFDAPPEEVFAVLWDVPSQADYMPAVKKAKRVISGETRQVNHLVIDPGVPMVKDRDLVSEATVLERSAERIVFAFKSAEEGVGPAPSEDYVRIPVQEGSWELTAIDGGRRTRAVYKLRTDPGGDVPKRAARAFAAKSLPGVFAAIRRRLRG
jgi:hypothetical protein